MPRKNDTEQRVLELLMNMADTGILQSELWRKIKADSREGSRAILRLERKELITRAKELHDGRWTYRVFAKRRYQSLNSIIDAPCPPCDVQEKCGQTGEINPGICTKMTHYLLTLSKNVSGVT